MTFAPFETKTSTTTPLQCDQRKFLLIFSDLITIEDTDRKIIVLKEENGFFYPKTEVREEIGQHKTDKDVILKVCEFLEANKERSVEYIKELRILKKNISENKEIRKIFRELIDNILVFRGNSEAKEEMEQIEKEGFKDLFSESEKIKGQIDDLKNKKKMLQVEIRELKNQINTETKYIQNINLNRLFKDNKMKRISWQINNIRRTLPSQ